MGFLQLNEGNQHGSLHTMLLEKSYTSIHFPQKLPLVLFSLVLQLCYGDVTP